MELSELFLNRHLYKDTDQNSGTKDASFISADSSSSEPTPIPSGGAAQDINQGNVFINGAQLEPGTFPVTLLDVANWGWGQTCAFSVASATQVNWGAGTFTSADGTSYAISAGNTGAMAAKTYIYLDLNISETAYQKTTTPADAVGIGKVLIAVAQNGATNATYNLTEANQIVGDNILANTINASKIVAGSITATQISASYIYAGSISADQINAGTLTGRTVQTASSGKRVVISGSNNEISFFDTNGTNQGYIFAQSSDNRLWIGGTNGIALQIGGNNIMSITGSSVSSFKSFFPSSNNSFDLGGGSLRWRDLYCRDVRATRDIEGLNVYGNVYPDNGVSATITGDGGGNFYLFSDGILILVF